MAWLGTVGHGPVRHGMAWHGTARRGMVWHGMAWCTTEGLLNTPLWYIILNE